MKLWSFIEAFRETYDEKYIKQLIDLINNDDKLARLYQRIHQENHMVASTNSNQRHLPIHQINISYRTWIL